MVSARELDNRRREIERIYGKNLEKAYPSIVKEYYDLKEKVREIEAKNREKKRKKLNEVFEDKKSFFSKYPEGEYSLEFDATDAGMALERAIKEITTKKQREELEYRLAGFMNRNVHPYWDYRKNTEHTYGIPISRVPGHPLSPKISYVKEQIYEIISEIVDLKKSDKELLKEFREELNKYLYNTKYPWWNVQGDTEN